MLALDAIARRYGKLPSQVLGETDEYKAICIDKWAFTWAVQEENAQMRKMKRGR